MSLNIKNPQAHTLAQTLAEATGETLTDAVISALRERLATLGKSSERALVSADVATIQRFLASIPDRDTRAADDILGYDAFGLPR